MVKSPQSDVDRALEAYHSGNLGTAERLLKKLLRRNPVQADCRHLLGLIAFQHGYFKNAARQIDQAVAIEPENPTFCCNLGAALLEAGATREAIANYEKAIALRPRYPQALANLGLAYARIDELAKAEEAHRTAIEIVPEDAAVHFNLANFLAASGRDDEAIDAYGDALRHNRNYVEAHSNLASIFRGPGDFTRALQHLDEAERQNSGNFVLQYNLASTLQQAGRLALARDRYLIARDIAPDSIDVRINLAAVLVDLARPGEAIELLRECCEARPDDASLRASLASLLEQVNQLPEAREHLRMGLEQAPSDGTLRLLDARFRRRGGDIAASRDMLLTLLTESLPPEIEAKVAIELGVIWDRLGAWDEALKAFQRGNQLTLSLESTARYDLEAYRKTLSANGLWFENERIARAASPSFGTHNDPIFFVGFLRSGTTLVEQILVSHPDVDTSAEAILLASTMEQLRSITGSNRPYPDNLKNITNKQIDALRDHYWAQSDDLGRLPGRRWVDKLPLNIVHLGFVKWIFPNAKNLVALRGPRDVVISCFMQSFRPNAAMAHFSSIESATALYVAVMDLWLYFCDVLGADWMEYRYEDLIAQPEAVVRKILAHLELDWTDQVLDHTQQARHNRIATPSYVDVMQPINARAIGRWRNYREQLIPVDVESSIS